MRQTPKRKKGNQGIVRNRFLINMSYLNCIPFIRKLKISLECFRKSHSSRIRHCDRRREYRLGMAAQVITQPGCIAESRSLCHSGLTRQQDTNPISSDLRPT